MNRKLPLVVVGLTVLQLAALGSPARADDPCDQAATKAGTNGHDVLRGTPGRDVIKGRGGNDTIYGLGRGDTLCGGFGNDNLYGGKGADYLDGQEGNDNLYGGPAYDNMTTYDSEVDNDWVDGQADGGSCTINYGEEGNDEYRNCTMTPM